MMIIDFGYSDVGLSFKNVVRLSFLDIQMVILELKESVDFINGLGFIVKRLVLRFSLAVLLHSYLGTPK